MPRTPIIESQEKSTLCVVPLRRSNRINNKSPTNRTVATQTPSPTSASKATKDKGCTSRGTSPLESKKEKEIEAKNSKDKRQKIPRQRRGLFSKTGENSESEDKTTPKRSTQDSSVVKEQSSDVKKPTTRPVSQGVEISEEAATPKATTGCSSSITKKSVDFSVINESLENEYSSSTTEKLVVNNESKSEVMSSTLEENISKKENTIMQTSDSPASDGSFYLQLSLPILESSNKNEANGNISPFSNKENIRPYNRPTERTYEPTDVDKSYFENTSFGNLSKIPIPATPKSTTVRNEKDKITSENEVSVIVELQQNEETTIKENGTVDNVSMKEEDSSPSSEENVKEYAPTSVIEEVCKKKEDAVVPVEDKSDQSIHLEITDDSLLDRKIAEIRKESITVVSKEDTEKVTTEDIQERTESTSVLESKDEKTENDYHLEQSTKINVELKETVDIQQKLVSIISAEKERLKGTEKLLQIESLNNTEITAELDKSSPSNTPTHKADDLLVNKDNVAEDSPQKQEYKSPQKKVGVRSQMVIIDLTHSSSEEELDELNEQRKKCVDQKDVIDSKYDIVTNTKEIMGTIEVGENTADSPDVVVLSESKEDTKNVPELSEEEVRILSDGENDFKEVSVVEAAKVASTSKMSNKKHYLDKPFIAVMQGNIKAAEHKEKRLSGEISKVVRSLCSGIKNNSDVLVHLSLESPGHFYNSDNEAIPKKDVEVTLTAEDEKQTSNLKGSKRTEKASSCDMSEEESVVVKKPILVSQKIPKVAVSGSSFK